MKLQAIIPALALLGAASCAFADADPLLGVSVHADERAEIIDRNPQYRGDPAPGSNGAKAVRALTRYRLDREKPLILPTSDTKSGATGTPVNGTGELLNGSQVLAGDNASGQGSTGRAPTEEGGSNSSNSKASVGGPASR